MGLLHLELEEGSKSVIVGWELVEGYTRMLVGVYKVGTLMM